MTRNFLGDDKKEIISELNYEKQSDAWRKKKKVFLNSMKKEFTAFHRAEAKLTKTFKRALKYDNTCQEQFDEVEENFGTYAHSIVNAIEDYENYIPKSEQ